MFYQKPCQAKIADLFKTNNFAILRFFVSHILLLKEIEFWIFNSIFLNLKEKYTSCEKILRFKFVDFNIENNFV